MFRKVLLFPRLLFGNRVQALRRGAATTENEKNKNGGDECWVKKSVHAASPLSNTGVSSGTDVDDTSINAGKAIWC